MPTIKEQISEQMKSAMKAGEKDKLAAIRYLHAAIRKKEIDDRVDLDDAGAIKIISTLIKQRQDSIEQFKAGNREDLVDKETAELKLLQSYLPDQMNEGQVTQLVLAAITEAKAVGLKDMGAVMKILMPKTAGKADNKMVSQIVNQKLKGSN